MARLEQEIKLLREKNEVSEARVADAQKILDEQTASHEAEKAAMESAFQEEKVQLMLDWAKEKADMEANFMREKADLEAKHVQDKQDTKTEAERAAHLESSQQRLTLQNVQAENRHLKSKNEDRC